MEREYVSVMEDAPLAWTAAVSFSALPLHLSFLGAGVMTLVAIEEAIRALLEHFSGKDCAELDVADGRALFEQCGPYDGSRYPRRICWQNL